MDEPDIKMDNPGQAIAEWEVLGPPEFERLGAAENVRLHSDRVLEVWALGILTRGVMHAVIGPTAASIGAGDYYLMPPGVRHYGTREGWHDVVWYTFKAGARPAAAATGEGVTLPVFGPMPPEFDPAQTHRFLAAALEGGLMSPAAAGRQLGAILEQMAVEAQRRRLRADPARRLAHEVLARLRQLRRQNLEPRRLEAEFHYSYGHLDRLFRRVFRCSLHARHERLRLDTGAELILQGVPLKETAAALGYGDYYYFLRVFRKVRGQSPTAFLAQYGAIARGEKKAGATRASPR